MLSSFHHGIPVFCWQEFKYPQLQGPTQSTCMHQANIGSNHHEKQFTNLEITAIPYVTHSPVIILIANYMSCCTFTCQLAAS